MLDVKVELTNLRVYDTAIDKITKGPGGMVARHITRIGRDVEKFAKRNVGKDTRTLLRSIILEKGYTVSGEFEVTVSGNTPYAAVHHTGSRPHPITMTLTSSKGKVFRKTVQHHGTSPNPYLTMALAAALAVKR